MQPCNYMYMTCSYSLVISAMTERQQPGLDRVECTARPLCQAAETVFHWYYGPLYSWIYALLTPITYCGPGFWYIVAESRLAKCRDAQLLSLILRMLTEEHDIMCSLRVGYTSLLTWCSCLFSFSWTSTAFQCNLPLHLALLFRLWRERRHLFASLYPSFRTWKLPRWLATLILYQRQKSAIY